MTQRISDLTQRVAEDPWDADAWSALCAEALINLPYSEAAPHLARAAERFPTAVSIWVQYIDAASNSAVQLPASELRDIYEQAVKSAPTSHELWRRFAKWAEANADLEDPAKLYESAIKAAGLDLTANALWTDYIDYVKRKDMPESNKRDALRKLLQRAIRNPMQDVDKLWQMYRTFEETSNSNKELGRGLIAEMQPRHVAARAEFRARRTRREGLALSALPVPPRGRPKEASQANQWRRFIAAERANPHGLDHPSLHTRVVHAYETAIAPLYRYPDIWIDYLSYVAETAIGSIAVPNLPHPSGKSSGLANASTNALAQGPSAGSTSMASSGGVGSDRPASIVDFEILAARAVRALPENISLSYHIAWLWMRFANSSNALSTLEALVKANPSPLAYVHLMRLTRKVSGTAAARKVFAKARRDSQAADPVVFIAAAQMEFIVNKDNKVARNVFEFGLKHFGTNALMVREFVEWLWGLGDFDHLRVVLKRVMPTVTGPPEVVRGLWERWIELEEAVGDIATVESVDNLWRDSGVTRTQTAVSEAVRRSRFLGLEGMREEELAVAGLTAAGVSAAGVAGSGGGLGASNAGSASTGPGGIAHVSNLAAGIGGGGKRDPRTGRRVGTGSVATPIANSSSGDAQGSSVGSDVVNGLGSVPLNEASGPSSIPNAGLLNMEALLPGSTFDEIEVNLRRLGAQMQHINAPAPDSETVIQLLKNTPDSFKSTPAYAALSASHAPGLLNGPGTGTGPASVGKKRSNDEISLTAASVSNVGQTQPRHDLFRSRQAAKQSRIR